MTAHTKDLHEKSLCKLCGTMLVGAAHKQHHENTIHGKETQPPVKTNKPWVQPKKTYINRKIKRLQKEVSELNKDGNMYNNLIDMPEIPELDKIKKHFTKTVTTEQCREALDRLDKWVAKEKASKTAARIRETILLKAEKKEIQSHERVEDSQT